MKNHKATKPSRLNRPGMSMMAQSEPMVWFTGGGLAISLAMIIGLLCWITYNGSITFWPTPISKVQLNDRQYLMGEIVAEEDYFLRKSMLTAISPANQDIAKELLRERERANVHRRQFRTGNFDITNEHFRWLSDFEFQRDTEVQPEWALTVERIEWGRFYGEPIRYTVETPRVAPDLEKLYADLILFLQNQFRWQISDEQQVIINNHLPSLTETYQALRADNIATFIEKNTQVHENNNIQIITEFSADSFADYQPDATKDVTGIKHVWRGASSAWKKFQNEHTHARQRYQDRRSMEKHDIGAVNRRMENARLSVRQAELDFNLRVLDDAIAKRETLRIIEAIELEKDTALNTIQRSLKLLPADLQRVMKQLTDPVNEYYTGQAADYEANLADIERKLKTRPAPVQQIVADYLAIQKKADQATEDIQKVIDESKAENNKYKLTLITAQGVEKELALDEIVRAYPANQLSLGDKWRIYIDRWREFLVDDPREANSEGGVFPAVWGTVTMTLIMCLVVAPFGVLAALYLREYANDGLIVSIIRIAINNLAGVPSIVFGVFGLGFFCYIFGAYTDGGPKAINITPFSTGVWIIGLTTMLAIIVAAIFCNVWLIKRKTNVRTTHKAWLYSIPAILWCAALGVAVILLVKTPFFNGFFEASLPNPTFGKGGLLWASLTLALLTLPVVIVATEEALSAVPNSLREGSFATGASKWQTIRRVVLPHATPGIMTGMVLAMARGAGEVAPLMLVGAVKLAPDLPMDMVAPFVHLERSFMHLGFHIYDLGFQSQNSEAAQPMVYTTALLLVGIILILNITAILLRNRLRRRFTAGHF